MVLVIPLPFQVIEGRRNRLLLLRRLCLRVCLLRRLKNNLCHPVWIAGNSGGNRLGVCWESHHRGLVCSRTLSVRIPTLTFCFYLFSSEGLTM